MSNQNWRWVRILRVYEDGSPAFINGERIRVGSVYRSLIHSGENICVNEDEDEEYPSSSYWTRHAWEPGGGPWYEFLTPLELLAMEAE